MTFSSGGLRAEAAAGPRERARGQRLGQRRAGRSDLRAYVREQLFEQVERVDPLEPEWPVVEIDEDHVRLAARAEALGKGEAHPALEPGRVERASRRRPRDAGGAVVGVAAAAAEAGEDQPGVSHAWPWYPSGGHARGGARW